MVDDYERYIEEISKRTGFIKSTIEKVDRLLKILEWINSHQTLKNLLALKGGTAINTAIFDFPRLSVDIDLDFTQNLSKEDTILNKNLIHDLITKYLIANGYRINPKKSKNVYALDSIAAEYIDIKGNPDRIKIEINYMNRVHILNLKRLSMAEDIFKDRKLSILCLDPIEIFATKICALINRSTARDLFDVYKLSECNLFSKSEIKLLKKCFFLEYIAICGYELDDIQLTNLKNIKKQDIKTKLLPTLKDRNPKKYDINKMNAIVEKYLSEILKLDNEILYFYNEFQRGKYKPEILFDDIEIVKRVEKHPMIMWKLNR